MRSMTAPYPACWERLAVVYGGLFAFAVAQGRDLRCYWSPLVRVRQGGYLAARMPGKAAAANVTMVMMALSWAIGSPARLSVRHRQNCQRA